MRKLKHTGPGYHGGSPDGTLVWAKTGDIVEVADEKATQLLTDFPTEWEEVKAVEVQEVAVPKKWGRK